MRYLNIEGAQEAMIAANGMDCKAMLAADEVQPWNIHRCGCDLPPKHWGEGMHHFSYPTLDALARREFDKRDGGRIVNPDERAAFASHCRKIAFHYLGLPMAYEPCPIALARAANDISEARRRAGLSALSGPSVV